MPNSSGAEYKVVLLGEGRVGKTSLISRYLNDTFDPQAASTVQATMHTTKGVSVPSFEGTGDQLVQLAIWDTAGQERFHALAPLYYRSAVGAMVVYDVTDRDTLAKARVWVQELHAVVGEAIRLVLCGNKKDVPPAEHEVPEREGLALAQEVGGIHFLTSALTGEGVTEAFTALAGSVASYSRLNNRSPRRGGGVDGGDGRRRRVLRIDESSEDMHTGRVILPYEPGGDPYAPRPPRARRPLNVHDMAPPTEPNRMEGEGSSGGGGCC